MANEKLLEDVAAFLDGRSAASLDDGAELNLPLRIGDELHRLRNRAIPTRLFDSLQRYVAGHVVTGGFLRAVLENDLAGAVLRADPESLDALPIIVRWLHDEAPGPCWGSVEAVAKWLARGAIEQAVLDAEAPDSENAKARRVFLQSIGGGA